MKSACLRLICSPSRADGERRLVRRREDLARLERLVAEGAALVTITTTGASALAAVGPLVLVIDTRVGTAADAPPSAHRILRVDTEGRWFEPPAAARVVCKGRPVMWRMLLALVHGSRACPPRPLTSAELVRAGWPGERIRPDAARNRLHVMLTRMRGQGLRDVLVGSDAGYCFAPDLSIEVA